MNWDVFTTVVGAIGTAAGIACAVFPRAVPIAGPIAAVAGLLFSYGTNKGGHSKAPDPNEIAAALKGKHEPR